MKTRYIIFFIIISGLAYNSTAKAQQIALNRADKKFEKQYYAQAVEIYERIADETTNDQHVVRNLAESYMQMNQFVKAEEYYRQLVEMDAAQGEDFYNYAAVLQANRKYDEANQWIEKYYATNREDSRAERLLQNDHYFQELMADSARFDITHLALNSNNSDFSPAYYGNNLVFVSSRTLVGERIANKYQWNNEPFLDLFIASPDSAGKYRNITRFSGKLNSDYHEGPVIFNEDLDKMYFTRNNFLNKPFGQERVNRLKIYSSKYVDNQWTEAESMPFNSDDYSCGHPTLTPDGKTMYFASDMPGGYGGSDIYRTKLTANGWSKPENLGETINTEGDELFPFMHPDGTLYFASEGLPGLGGLDIFSAKASGSSFAQPENLGYPLNSSLDDFGLIIDKAKLTGYFSSNRAPYLNDEIFRVIFKPRPPVAVRDEYSIENDAEKLDILPLENDRLGDGKVINITGYDFESTSGAKVEFSASENKFTYYPKADFEGIDSIRYTVCDTFSVWQGCDENIIQVNVNDVFYGVIGLVVLKKDQTPISGVKVELISSSARVLLNDTTNTEGGFRYELDKNTEYTLRFTKKGYISKTMPLSTIEKPEGYQNVKQVIELDKMEVGFSFTANILFDTGKHNIRPDAAEELDEKVYAFLIEHPTAKIELSAHTDARGSASSNQALSQRRAQASVDYLVQKGIDPNRMVAKGYGEERLLNHCKDGVSCSEAEHQVNRRVEIEVLEY